jgi:hypothetical protein
LDASGGGVLRIINGPAILNEIAPPRQLNRSACKIGLEMALHKITACLLVFVGSLTLSAGQQPQRGWKLVRSVDNPSGGTYDFVLIPKSKQRAVPYYETIANKICGEKSQCGVFFWIDASHIPTSADFPARDLAVMTGQYERHPSYEKPHLRLACWLYESKTVAERANCFYAPGEKRPPK